MKSIRHFQRFEPTRVILHKLLLLSGTIPDIGLAQGKMGMVFFFMHYYRQTGNSLYEDIACDLLDEVTEKLHKDFPVTFESGLSGIGWAVNYLIAKEYVEGDSLEICEEVDLKIMETDPRRFTDYSLEKGIGGILLYVLAHCKVVFGQHGELPFDACYLQDLYSACINLCSGRELPAETVKLLDAYLLLYTDKVLPDESIWDVSAIVQGITDFEEKKVSEYPLGIRKGLAGMLFEKHCSPNITLL